MRYLVLLSVFLVGCAAHSQGALSIDDSLVFDKSQLGTDLCNDRSMCPGKTEVMMPGPGPFMPVPR